MLLLSKKRMLIIPKKGGITIKKINPRLEEIKKQKSEIKKEMKECYNLERLFELDEAYDILDKDEREILDNLGVDM